MRRLFFTIWLTGALTLCDNAQLHLKANIQNNHLWRGMEVADGIVLLTDLSCSVLNDHVVLGLWGGCNSQGSYKEFNHYLSLKNKGWSLSLWDTYNFSPGATYNNHQYWNYSAHSTGRFLDATLAYASANASFPLTLSWSTVIFGRDRSSDNTHQKYSTFLYAEYPIYRKDEWNVQIGAGAAFALNSAGEESHFYGTGAGIVHASLQVSRNLQLGRYSLPVYARCMWNPQSELSYFQLGIEAIHF